MIARKPEALSFNEAASVPVIAVTALQMLFDYAQAQTGQSVLIHGAGGNVGAYAVQLAQFAGLRVFATASSKESLFLESLGAGITIVDYTTTRFEDVMPHVDIVLDMVGGDTRQRSFQCIKSGGILVSVVSGTSSDPVLPPGVRSVFFLVEVTTQRLEKLTALFDRGQLAARSRGRVLPLDQARQAHEMLGGAPAQKRKDHSRASPTWIEGEC